MDGHVIKNLSSTHVTSVDTGVVSNGQVILACRSHGYSASWQRKLNVTWLALCVFVAPLCAVTISGVKIATTVDVACLPLGVASPLQQPSADRRSRIVGRIKLRAIKLTVLVLLAHIFCWTPYFSVNLLNVWTDYRLKDSVPYAVILISQCTAWFSSCVNPIIYAVFNLTMDHLRSLFCRIAQKKARLTDQPFRDRVRHVNSYDSFRLNYGLVIGDPNGNQLKTESK
ncbi:hypothetical protein RvY_16185 [Ramazzottius varieornatus]|uniref:G-protein coupled receptors family 1 profile domain-containing protein n=1 Tax=Ramazzottius varieornatus TaxID=947166 RepID=A0A1D1VXJ3_RAMVA|nr:hypothetical protein RvY_16185 [Ramazzottius varieornatus]